MRIAVTGASGNVGTALLRALADEPEVTSVVGIARRLPSASFPKTEWTRADVAEDDLRALFDGADCVVHLAWLIQPSHDRLTTWRANVLGSRRVFEAAAAAGVPALVHASSVGAYSRGPKSRAVDESWPTDGIRTSFYSRDKSDAERLLDEVEERHPELRVVRLRPSLIFQRAMGTEVKRLFTGRWVPHRLVLPGRIPVVPDIPGLRFQVTHADDVADAYRRAIVSDARGAFNVAADPVLDPDALARLLGARKVPVPAGLARALVAATWRLHLQPTPEGWVDMALQTPLLDSTRIRDELGWEPARAAGEALLDLLHGFHDGAGVPTPPLRA
ncbi:MAG TPA: NAD-dependent epimerase/dehydratase family protein [Gaiellaceae bacterium]